MCPQQQPHQRHHARQAIQADNAEGRLATCVLLACAHTQDCKQRNLPVMHPGCAHHNGSTPASCTCSEHAVKLLMPRDSSFTTAPYFCCCAVNHATMLSKGGCCTGLLRSTAALRHEPTYQRKQLPCMSQPRATPVQERLPCCTVQERLRPAARHTQGLYPTLPHEPAHPHNSSISATLSAAATMTEQLLLLLTARS